MRLDQLPGMLLALKEETRWQLIVHPDAEHQASRYLRMMGLEEQVELVVHHQVRRDEAFLINPAAVWREEVDWEGFVADPDRVSVVRQVTEALGPRKGTLISKIP